MGEHQRQGNDDRLVRPGRCDELRKFGHAALIGRRLARSFFARDVLEVAPDLIGRVVRRGEVALRITETEAYRWPGDTACHARAGRTPRTEPLFGPPGRAYVYLCYGIHHMLNVVTGEDGMAQAVLVRAAEVVRGEAVVLRRRGAGAGRHPCAGPGKVGQALALDTRWSGHPLYSQGELTVHAGEPAAALLRGPRVGIGFATKAHQRLLWRFADAGSEHVTVPRTLRAT